jgi:thymidine phosphorylase
MAVYFRSTGAAITGASDGLVPANRKPCSVHDVTATVDSQAPMA